MSLFDRHPHQRNETWDTAPPWALELGAIILSYQEIIMSLADDLKATSANLATAVTALSAAIDAKPSTVPAISDADLQTVIGELTSTANSITAIAAKLFPPAVV